MTATRKPLDTLAQLTSDPANRRKHTPRNVGMIVDALHKVGAARSIVIDEDNVVLAGNATLDAAAEAGITKLQIVDADGETVIAVRRSNLTADQKRALAIYDNRTAELAEWDTDQLRADLDAGLDLSQFFHEDELAALLAAAVEPKAGKTDPDAVPDERATDIKAGDLFELGKHRLLCGDSTKAEDVARLMAGHRADCVFIDPPYNHASEDKGIAAGVSKAHRDLMASEWDKDFNFLAVAPRLDELVAADCTVYVCTSWHLAGDIWAWMAANSKHHSYCVWHKPNPMPSLMKRHWTWASELICYATYGKHTFNFPAEGHASNVWTITKKSDGSHPTQKPVELVLHALRHSATTGQIVADLFCGSGTTLMACEQLDLSGRFMEISPSYCQVAIDRWEAFVGLKAVKVGDAVPA